MFKPEVFRPTAEGLVEFARKALVTPHVYLWDGNGEYLTDEVLDALAAEYPNWYTPDRYGVRKALCNKGIRGWDCIGLIKSYVWHDYSQYHPEGYKAELDYCTRTLRADESLFFGEMKDLPEIPGIVLWKQGHVGVYEGGGFVLESTGSGPNGEEVPGKIGGVRRSRIEEKPWEKWVKFPGIQYPENE